MKKTRIISLLLAVCMIFGMLPVSAAADTVWDGSASSEAPAGSGTADDPYQISDAPELKWFADAVNGSQAKSMSLLCAVLTENINLSGAEWTPIGRCTNTYSDYVIYGGTFDGGGKCISGLKIDNAKQYQALFGYVKGAVIKNLTVNGTVSTSTTSSSYAAGIAAYVNPAVIENCVSNVNVTSSQKGYIAGIAAYAASGSVISGCTNTGRISGCGDYVGGIVGTAIGTSVKNCFNRADITCTAKPSSYTYCVGGIAGGISSSSVISMSANTGDITSTIKRTGGIAGGLGGTVEKCFNTGRITGIYGVGGIAGDSSDKAGAVISCYNLGDVTAAQPTVSFNDTNAKGAGGIIGGVSSSSYAALVQNCYSTGAVISDTSVSDVTFGGVIGSSSGKKYDGSEVTGLITAENCYYLGTSAEQGDGSSALSGGISAKVSDEMRESAFAAALGDAYISAENDYPLLGWQNPDALYRVTFTSDREDTAVTVYDEGGSVISPTEGMSYALKNGTYSYRAAAHECEDAAGTFTVAYGGQNISLSMNVKKYDFVFTTDPADAYLSVEGETPLADGRTYRLPKSGNPYSYTLSAFGYHPASGTFNVTGGEADALTVVLEKQPLYRVTLPYRLEEGGSGGNISIHVSSAAYPEANIKAEADGSFMLPDGEYSYKISCKGYKSVGGEFAVNGGDFTAETAYLAIQTAWDGVTLSQPAADSDGVYLISSPDELMWFNKNAALTDSARLTSDIRINDDMSDTSSLFSWAPIGSSSSKAYTGTFDGGGHTVSGIYINSSANCTALFGFVGTAGSVSGVTLSDSIINGGKSYTGGIVGDLKGNITGCHVSDSVEITGQSYVGGIVGELDSGGSVKDCSNAGSVTASASYCGGIAGRVYSSLSSALCSSFNSGSVSAKEYAGGVTGGIYSSGGTLKNVYSTGSVSSDGFAGGICGLMRAGYITNAYTSGSVSGTACGSIAGQLQWASGAKSLDHVYYLSSIAGSDIGSENGCTVQSSAVQSCSSAELKNMAAALGDLFYEDDGGINGGYPILYWQAGADISDPNAPQSDPSGWNGKTSSTPPAQVGGVYQISSAAELKWFAKAAAAYPDICGVLTADIDLNNRKWAPICPDPEAPFIGTFDGGGHTVSNLYISGGSAAGLFAQNGGEIKNLTLTGLIRGADNAGGAAAYNSGIISGVTADVSVDGGGYIAGIAAHNDGGVITGCSSCGNISGGQYVGGICAANSGHITASKNSGMIRANGSFAAGIAADNNSGLVRDCANSGHIISTAAVRLAFAGGAVGRNDGTAENLFNAGNVISLGSGVGGCVGINTSGSSAVGLYNTADVYGAYIETENGGEYRVGGCVGETVSGVSEAYYSDMLAVTGGGTPLPVSEIYEKAGATASMLPQKSNITGTVTLSALTADSTAAAFYEGNAENPVYVWYTQGVRGDTVLAISAEYKVGADMAGRTVFAAAMDASLYGTVSSAPGKVEGITGSVGITGHAVAGYTVTAVYTGEESSPAYQWYLGSTPIEGARGASYSIKESDIGGRLSVRVTGAKPGYIECVAGNVKSCDGAGIWPQDECLQPASDADGVYLISSESELKWFVGLVNGGDTSACARLIADIALNASKWYPIGNSEHPFAGTFDGDGKCISGLNITSAGNDQGFFGNIGTAGRIKDLSVSGDISITSQDAMCTGGIAGYLDGKITGCSFDGSISGARDAGGIAGQCGTGSEISQCINTSDVSGAENIGGIAGSCSYGNIIECINKGSVGKDGAKNVGGIAGIMTNYAVVTACINFGDITGGDYLGGIAGSASVCSAPQGCYSTGSVAAGVHAFGVLGDYSGSDYIMLQSGSYYLTESAQTATDKTAQGLNSASMKKTAFVSLLNAQAGASCFVADISGKNGGYPLLLWQTGGSSENPDAPDPQSITVTFTLRGDDPHGENGHTAYTDWISSSSCTVAGGTTAYELFVKMLEENGFSFEEERGGYISSVTGKGGVTLSEYTNGPRSGWMYTINGKYPDYMPSVKLCDGDNMVFFYTDDYKETDWVADDPARSAVERMIDAIGTVTLDSKAAIESARDAYDMLTDMQRIAVANADVLFAAEQKYAELLAQKPIDDKAAADAVCELISAIEDVTLDSRPAIKSAREAYDALTGDQKALVENYDSLVSAEAELERLVGEKTAADMAAADRADKLISSIGEVTVRSGAAIEAARREYDSLTSDQKAYVTRAGELAAAESRYAELVLAKAETLNDIYTSTGKSLAANPVPAVSSVGGEWTVIGLARAGIISDDFKTGYYKNVFKAVQDAGSAKLHRAKSTENSRVVIALTSLGYDPTDVGGQNLLEPLCDMDYISRQGINGVIWALIAFDTAGYEIPAAAPGGAQVTRDGLIAAILAARSAEGGWSLTGEGTDADITAMAITALAPYCGQNADVKAAVEDALMLLSSLQTSDGGFYSYSSSGGEVCAQVIVALTSLGINPDTDARFIKNGRSVLDRLTDFYTDGGFCHTVPGDTDLMTTEQAYYALAAYYRLVGGQSSLFDMRGTESSDAPVINISSDTDNNVNTNTNTDTDTNTDIPVTDVTSNPKTGEAAPAGIILVSLIALASLAASRKKRQAD